MKKTFLFVFSVLLAASILTVLTGCKEPASDNTTASPSVDSVDQASLHASVGVGDLDGIRVANTIPSTISKYELLDLLVGPISTIFENIDESEWDPESDPGFTYSTVPSNLFSLDEIPDDFTISGRLSDVEPISGMIINALGEADVSLQFTDDNLSRLIAELSLSDVDITVPVLSPGPYSDSETEILGGRIVAAANAGVNMNLSWDTYYDEYGYEDSELSDLLAAIALSLRLQAALSFTNPADYNGNVVVSLSYDEEAEIQIDEEMMDDDTAETYLDDKLGNGTFTMTVSVYELDSTLLLTKNYSIADLLDWAMASMDS